MPVIEVDEWTANRLVQWSQQYKMTHSGLIRKLVMEYEDLVGR